VKLTARTDSIDLNLMLRAVQGRHTSNANAGVLRCRITHFGAVSTSPITTSLFIRHTRSRKRVQPHDRRDIDNLASHARSIRRLILHNSARVLAAEEDTFGIHAHGQVEDLLVVFPDRFRRFAFDLPYTTSVQHVGKGVENSIYRNSSIVDHDIQATVFHERSVNKRRYLGFFGNVRALEDRVAAVLLDLFVCGSV
jgi:hypothetical protein